MPNGKSWQLQSASSTSPHETNEVTEITGSPFRGRKPVVLIAGLFGWVYRYAPMIFSKKNAGKWVASKGGKVLAADPRLSAVLKKVKGEKPDDIRLDLVPRTPFIAGGSAL